MTTVSAELVYFAPPLDGSRPFTNINADSTTGLRPRNWQQEVHTVEIESVRGKESDYTLDTAGFQYVTKPSKHSTFINDEEIRREYYPESIELLKDITGASKVILFDHTVRRHRPGDAETDESKRQPVNQVHVDQTPESATARVHRHLPAGEAEKLVKKRFQIINLWRPYLSPCNRPSIGVKDLVPVTLVYPDREGETFGVKFNPTHRWKYERGMKPDEVVLIKCYDSAKDDNIAKFTPHTGFKDPSAPQGVPLRESIELRALVFYE
ncbi:hypothetical protein DFJ58DRAFT_717223 [Suillus subalutaceus]|uniref:uncharacterized protein n=1 Tax=Suillus subalutaceus TaxID=48586 RepID=UPI001B879033|nr:uncharacterized protein DFJ58DRAFT_717223 [Suillus subalutaceus]KAG1847341.1 hypothetical protein DFJ58DRAFT_717223 [Suillus subalutaceus]